MIDIVHSRDYELFCNGRLADPYPLLHELRSAEPVLFGPGTIHELKFVCSQRGLGHCRSSCPDSRR